MIETGSTVAIEFTLTLDNGQVVSTATEDDPLVYEQGKGEILPALEDALAGLAVDDRKEVHLPPEQGFGVVDPSLYETVPIDEIPEEARRPGVRLEATDPQGQRRLVEVEKVEDDHVVINLNHPLAGQALLFNIRVLGIDAP